MFWDKTKKAIFRPFAELVNVKCRARSLLLEKVLVDFGADESFKVAVEKVKEHYGVDIAISTTRLDVEKHAQAIHKLIGKNELMVSQKTEAHTIIGQTDGSMIPTVTIKDKNDKKIDQRKNKNHEWKEARLAMAKQKGSVDAIYAAVIGSVDEAGAKLSTVVRSAGEGEKTKIHCVGDGATWISDQVDKLFGTKAKFLLDFFHVSEYLAQAATCCNKNDAHDWMRKQQALLKNNSVSIVLEKLQGHVQLCPLKENCQALKCLNYLSKRLEQLDYKGAIENDLPIGSGEIESAHRSIVQKRLKIPGAWWTIDNAQNMLDLRITRANGLWGQYWGKFQTSGVSHAYG